ncbi:MAG TPA: hemolysin family protein [Gammaproteobacteria bacterium]
MRSRIKEGRLMLVDLVIVLGLVLLNGLFAMSELAVVSSRKSRLQSLARRGVRGARTALRLSEDPTAFLSTVQIGITLVGILAGAFSGVALGEEVADWLARFGPIARYAEPIAIGTIVVAITYVTLIVGELVPKRIALRRPERIAVVVAPSMQALSRVAAPLVFVLKHSTEGVMRLLRLGGGQESPVTEEEVRMLIAEGTRAGVFLATEREMIEGVLRLADRRVRAIMTPRQEVVWLDVNASPEEIAETITEHHASRYPVCRETIDNPVGVVDVRDLAAALLKRENVRLSDLIVPPLVVPEGVYVLNLLDLFRKEGAQMAIVIDEYGATEGVVTLSDILEAITGELPERGEAPELELVRRSDGSWLVDGAYPIDEFEDRLRLRGLRDDGDYDTVAGYALHRLERLPEVGDSFTTPCGRFEILDMDGNRIDKMLFVPNPDPPPPQP